jgi:aryl-alcohol dehydrogenase-like predicted oxidoreductase
MGRGLDQKATQEIVDTALDCGINYFDTADKYGETRSESFLGEAIKGKRSQVIVATKFGLVLPDQPESGGASASWIRKAVVGSLARLNTDYIDLYQLHRPDPNIPLEETLGALNELVLEGLVVEIGVSNATAVELQQAHDVSTANGFSKYVSVQNEYSMIRRSSETDGVFDFCETTGTAFVPYYPLASGLLTGKYQHGKPDPEGTRLSTIKLYQDWFSDDDHELAKDIVSALISEGYDPLVAAIQWILRQSSVSCVITGASRPQQVLDNTAAVNTALSSKDLDAISAIVAEAST